MGILKRILTIILRISISVALLIFLFKIYNLKVSSLLVYIKSANKGLLLLAFFLFFFNYALCFFRWVMLLNAVEINLPLKRVFISFCGGIFFSLFLPSTIGGDLMRGLDLSAHTRKPKEVVTTVLLDRLSGSVGLVFLVLFSLIFGWNFVRNDKSVLLSIGIIIAILSVILLSLFNNFFYSKINKLLKSPNAGRIRESIKDLHEEIYIFKDKKSVIVNNLFISFIIQATSPLVYYITALSLGIKINIIYFLIFLPIIGAITLLPISIGGLGLREATTIFFFAKAGVSGEMAFAMSMINFLFILIYGALGGVIYVLTIHHRRIQHNLPRGLP